MTYASPGLDELIFRALNLAGSDPILDRIMIFSTILSGVYVIFLVAVPLWLRGLRTATFDVLLLLAIRFRWRLGIPAGALAVLAGISRIYLGLHWPSDVLGGAAVGIGFALLIEVVSRRVEPYQRIRARIVEAIPHLPRRSRGG